MYREHNRLYTVNLAPGTQVYGEPLVERDGVEYRAWNPHRSKAASAIMNGLEHFPLGENSKALYLGAASGTTVSHFSDICTAGLIVAVEKSRTEVQKLLKNVEERGNVAPVLGDASTPENYQNLVSTGFDVVYQDLAQRDQARIFLRNMDLAKNTGWGVLCVKAGSITSQQSFHEIVENVTQELAAEVDVVETVDLAPFHKQHVFIVCRNK